LTPCSISRSTTSVEWTAEKDGNLLKLVLRCHSYAEVNCCVIGKSAGRKGDECERRCRRHAVANSTDRPPISVSNCWRYTAFPPSLQRARATGLSGNVGAQIHRRGYLRRCSPRLLNSNEERR
jgi:hypothetical protein